MSAPLIPVNHIIELAAGSALAKVVWRDRGRAPLGYVEGMALVYGRVYAKFKDKDPAALDMAKKNSGDDVRDALSWYNSNFKALHMSNDVSGVNTLRHLFVLQIGLGMRESSGRYCEGRDMSARNVTSETAEAGLFQASFNARIASPLMTKLFNAYHTDKEDSGYLSVFQKGVKPTKSGLQNYGSGEGFEFQRMCKQCPAFASEFAAVGMRHLRKHWGPLNRKQAQIRPEADMLLHQVEGLIDVVPHDAPHIA